jgi:lysophospholipase L1-like esterase
MRLAKFTAVALVAIAVLAPALANAKPAKKYYLALGDSLAVGVQPRADGVSVNTKDGYPAQLAKLAGVRLVNLGCGYATSGSVVNGKRPCQPKLNPGYKQTSARNAQLATAVKFIKSHKGKIAFVTIDIGANDVASCSVNGSIDFTCISNGVAAINKYVPTIARQLRKAGGSKLPMAAMTLYDPFLQSWFNPPLGPTIAKASVGIAKDQVNGALARDFGAQKFKIADVAVAFDTYAPFPASGEPLAVQRICQYTWMCTPKPRGPNIHANKQGYGVIARTFRSALGKAAR